MEAIKDLIDNYHLTRETIINANRSCQNHAQPQPDWGKKGDAPV